jgi:hypothetical protein
LSQSEVFQREISIAEERSKAYDWKGAAEAYKTAIESTSESDEKRLAGLYEELGYAISQAAMQSETPNEFQNRFGEANSSFEKSLDLYKKLGEEGKELRCRAMLALGQFWKTSNALGRKKWLNESWSFTEKALEMFEKASDGKEFWKTLYRLITTGVYKLIYSTNQAETEPMLNQLLNFSETALRDPIASENPYDLARAYAIAAGVHDWASNVPADPESQEKLRAKAKEYWMKGSELSPEAAYLQLVTAGPTSAFFGTGSDQGLSEGRKMLDYAMKSGNRDAIATALDNMAFHNVWRSRGVEDPTEQKSLLDQGLEYAKQVKEVAAPFPANVFFNPVMWADVPLPFYYFELSRLEFDPAKKRALLENATEDVSKMLKTAEDSGVIYNTGLAAHQASKILESLARLEADPSKKRRLLESALEHRKESVRTFELNTPNYYWDQGVMQNYLANIQYELSKIEPNPVTGKSNLRESLMAKERGLEAWLKAFDMIRQSPASIETFGERYLEYGDMLLESRLSTAVEIARAYEKGIELFQKSQTLSRAAEGYWKLAHLRVASGDHVKAAEAFRNASENYRLAAEKVPQLRHLYVSQSEYMNAWNNIETARQHHARQEYEDAARAYEKAASHHKSTSHWDYLAPNYSAWAEVERAEDLSRKDQTEQASRAFQKAEKLFAESKTLLSNRSRQAMNPDETEMVAKLISVAKSREHYCRARVTLEEAKNFDRRGEHHSSAETYGQSVQAFEKLISELRTDEPPAEFRLILALSRAWQKLAMAEAEASPELYLEASSLFEEAKQFSPTEKSKMLALGHSRFCKALEAGARFSDTRDRTFHEKAVQNLDIAANYYVKAGFEYASDYVKACKLLFDGYVYMDDANKERDHDKKTRLYSMAEKVLEGSADSYQKSNYPGKRDEVIALLKKVREDREIAGSLSDILHGPRVMSSTASFNMPTPTFEKAVGLEMFEHAAVQASLIVHSRDVKVGEDIDMEIELVNAGRGTAQLIKLEHIVPEGFNVTSQSENYRLEDSFLNLKGRQLSPLKTEEVKLVAKPRTRGKFTVRPRILYLDETGSYKSYEPDPVEINVKELGLSGWVRGR